MCVCVRVCVCVCVRVILHAVLHNHGRHKEVWHQAGRWKLLRLSPAVYSQ